MLDKTKRAAKFMGYPVVILQGFEYYELSDKEIIPIEDYNPYEKLGRHFLVEMIKKMNPEQYKEWDYMMLGLFQEYKKEGLRFSQWILIAPSKLCFESIMEAIK